jgi:heterokaryon incompatibility protein (HET)
VRRWLHVCRTEHKKCNNGLDRLRQFTLPKRLLLVEASEQAPDTIILIDSSSLKQSVLYATLSHCWGNVRHSRLLEANLKTYERGIVTADLPLTFREAVEVCQTLGVVYLWIDSLCIIQDSDADWNEEAPRMADIYSNALLTIAATASVDDEGGLFRSPNPQEAMPLLVTAHSGSDHQTSYHLHYEDDFQENVDAAPLNRRAWVLQERYLAARTVHFAENQIYWQCPSAFMSASDNTNLLVNYGDNYNFNSIESSTGNFTFSILENWDVIIEAYSQCKLTRPSDKLVAMSGLARRAYELLRCTPRDYLGGLWRQGLPANLLWSAVDGVKSDSYRAPSWCWASLDGQIHCADLSSGPTPMVEVLNASVHPVGDPFSAVDSGSLLLRGRLCNITLPKQLGTVAFTKHSPAQAVVKNTTGQSGQAQVVVDGKAKLLPAGSFTAIFDHSKPLGSNADAGPVICFLPIVDEDNTHTTDDNEKDSAILAGLMLEPIGQERGQYHRVGQLTFDTRTACNILRKAFGARDIREGLYQDLDGDDWYTIEIV